MGWNRVWRSLIVVTLGLGSTSALAQPGGVLGTLLGGLGQPSPSPAPVVSAKRPADLPLEPDEFVKPFANGCGLIGKYATSSAAVTTGTNWYGNCRFGLAHGDGVEQAVADNYRLRRRYQYGVVIGGTDARSSFPYTRFAKDGVFLGIYLENGYREAVSIRSPDLNVQGLKAAHPVSLTVEEPGVLVYDIFEPVALECSASGKVNWKSQKVSVADSVAADADCERYQASLGANRMPRNALVASVSLDVAAIQHTHQTRPTGGPASPKEFTARFCAGGAKSADCDRVLQEMLQPYAAHIQAIIDGQRRQYAEGLPWLTARYAPLEAAFGEKVRSIADRYAAASARTPSGVRP